MFDQIKALAEAGVQISIYANLTTWSANRWNARLSHEEKGIKLEVTATGPDADTVLEEVLRKWKISTEGLPSFNTPLLEGTAS